MPDPRVPKFRVPAAFVSPAALCLVGGLCYFFTLDFSSEDELNSNIKKEFPQVVRTSHEVDDRMKEFFKRVNDNDPREEDRMRNLLNQGKGSHYSAKRRHATPKEIEEFGFVPRTLPLPPSSPPPVGPHAAIGNSSSSSTAEGENSASVPTTRNGGAKNPEGVAGAAVRAVQATEEGGAGAVQEQERKPRRRGWFW